MPSNAVIDSATRRLYFHGCRSGDSPLLGAYAVTGPWNEDSVTWNTRPPSASLGVSRQAPCVVELGPVDWNAAGLATAWHSDPAGHYGLELCGVPNTAWYSLTHASREREEAAW
ncbi:MAG: DNRLRE domain-containing protein, partial [Chloroflexi bacterium]|nr:DNRLRE domain-containing protein [Chloroflexota bacterium]